MARHPAGSKRRLTLRSRVLLFTASIIVGLVTVTLGHAAYQAGRLAEGNVTRALRGAEERFDAFLRDEHARLRPALEILANDPTFVADVQTGEQDAAQRLLAERSATLLADALVVTDTQGAFVASSENVPGAFAAAVGALAHDVLGADDAKPAFGILSAAGKPYTVAAVPLRFGGQVAGLIVAGRVLSSERVGMATHSHAEIQDAPLPQGPFDERHDGERMRGTVRHLLSPAGRVVGSVRLVHSLDSELAPFARFRLSLLVAALAVLAIALSLASVGVRRLTEPLAALTRLAERLGEGAWSGETQEFRAGDEIGALGQAFERMRAGILAREQRIRTLALRDPLTLLPNRTLFDDRLGVALSEARRSGRPLSLLLMDLDHFKDINDTLGHQAGDAVLREVARRVSGGLRAADTIARLGGDEFTLLLPGADAPAARRIAAAILASLGSGVDAEGRTFTIKASVGIAAFPEHGEDGSTLLRHADMAMYAAKRRGGGAVRFEPGHARASRERLFVLDEIRRAVREDELVLHYQPKLHLATGQVHSVEALVRWNHPARGLLGPAEFLHVAERSDLIQDLTQWVIDCAVRQCGQWLHEGRPLDVAINVSARDLGDGRLEESVAGALERYRVPPERLCLEVTESAVMEDPAHGQAIIGRLRGLGLRVSLDDFGTGHSSLAYLSQLPVTELKIDRAFVQGVSRQRESDVAIARLIVELGHALGAVVVAEGVDDEGARRQLASMGCDIIQGYLLSKPLPAATLAHWLAPSNGRARVEAG